MVQYKPGGIGATIMNLSNHLYDHLDINDSIEKISKFTKIISKLFHQLSRLEYIGKRKEAGIFVKEEVVQKARRALLRNEEAFWQIEMMPKTFI